MNKTIYIIFAAVILAGCKNGVADKPISGARMEERGDTLLGKTEKELASATINVVETPGEDDKIEENIKNSEEVVGKLPSNGKPTLIDFSATWCGPCKIMKPVFNDLEDTYDDRMNFVNIDIDENPELSRRYNINAVPTFIFLDKNGNVVVTMEGAMEQSVLENQINKMI